MSNVVYIGHLPDGFNEQALMKFFSQFGDIKHARVSRSKTGKSRGYGFIQFVDADVAAIAVETMDGHLFKSKALRCEVLPDVPNNLFWKDCEHPKTPLPQGAIHREEVNKPKTPEERQESLKQMKEQNAKRAERLKDLGINYTIPDIIELK